MSLNSGMAIARRNAIIRAERESAKTIWNDINRRGFPHRRCTLKIIKIILLCHDLDLNLLDGMAVVFKKKSLGAGVYEVWMEAQHE